MIQMKINELTPEQTAALPAFRNEWLKWGICTDRADRPRAEAAILAMRERVENTNKPIFIWCHSPATAALAVHFLKSEDFKKWASKLPENSLQDSLRASLWDSLWDSLRANLQASLWDSLQDSLQDSLRASLWDSLQDSLRASLQASLWDSLRASLQASLRDSLRASLWDSLRASLQDSLRASLWDSLWDSLRDSLQDSLWNSWWGQHDGYWIAFYLFCRDVIGVKYDAQRSKDLNLWRDIAQSCCWWQCHDNYVIISERPTIVRLDDRNVLHSQSGPALAFADGWAVHSWHGTRIPGEWIEKPNVLTAAVALKQNNVEQRRAACEIIGWDKILHDLKSKTINRDDDPQIGELLEVSLPDAPRERFLRVQCGTGRTFAIPVPPTVKTALEANAWTYGLEPIEYQPEGRT